MTDLHSRTADALDLALADLVAGRPDVQVLDVGGGSGTRAVPLARQGCRVTVVDASIDALAILRRRAADAGVGDRVRAVQADAHALEAAAPAGSADVVLCHHVLESLDEPAAAVRGLVTALRPGGTVSVLVAGRHAALLAHAVAGRFAEAAVQVYEPDGRFGPADPLLRRFDIASITALLSEAGLEIRSVTGLGVVSGLVSGAVLPAGQHGAERLGELEAALSVHPVLREIATDLHVLASRPAD